MEKKNTIEFVKEETAILEKLKERIVVNTDQQYSSDDIDDPELVEIEEQKEKKEKKEKKENPFIYKVKKIIDDVENTRYKDDIDEDIKKFIKVIIENTPSVICNFEEILQSIYIDSCIEPNVKLLTINKLKQLLSLFRYVYTFHYTTFSNDDKKLARKCRDSFKILNKIFVFEYAIKINNLNEDNFECVTDFMDDVERLIRLQTFLKLTDIKPRSGVMKFVDKIRINANYYLCQWKQ